MKIVSITTIALIAATPLIAQTPLDPPALAPDLAGAGDLAEDAPSGT